MSMTRILRHPAVTKYGSGVSSADLADFVQLVSDTAALRVLRQGDAEYGGEIQAFELKDNPAFAQDIAEELLDTVNYVVMTLARTLHSIQEIGATELSQAYNRGWEDGEEYVLDSLVDKVRGRT